MKRSAALVQYSSNYGGSTISSQLGAKALVEGSWTVGLIFGFSGPFVDISREKGYSAHVIRHSSWLRRSNPAAFARSLWNQYWAADPFESHFRSSDYDLVYINSLVSLAPAIAARSVGLPVVWHIREQFSDVKGEMECPGWPGRHFVRAVVDRLASKIIVVSDSVRENVLGEWYSGSLEVIPNAVPERFFDVSEPQHRYREALGLPTGAPIVGVPGTLRPLKGHPFFLKAAPKILSEEDGCHFAITGRGSSDYEEHLRTLCRSLNLSSRVHFLGTVTTMEHFYGACDAVCVPSVAESFGRTVIEAFATRTPVVATKVGGLEETMTDGENGLLVEYGNVDELVRAIIALLRRSNLRARVAARAREEAEDSYHESVYKRRIRDAVSSVV